MNITRKWKRFMAVGCTHGHLVDQSLLKQVYAFKERWKPHTCIALGDHIDLACLRAGAVGTADDAADPEGDLNDGLNFISRFEPSVYLLGNHEHRLFTLMESPRAIVSALAARIYAQITDRAKQARCEVVPYSFQNGWRQYGDALFGHGYMINEAAVRDHAESICGPGNTTKVVIAHLHRVTQAEGRNRAHPTGYCTGWLGQTEQMGYAAHRRATTSWSRGFAWGEYSDTETIIWLAKETKNQTFRLPL